MGVTYTEACKLLFMSRIVGEVLPYARVSALRQCIYGFQGYGYPLVNRSCVIESPFTRDTKSTGRVSLHGGDHFA